MQPGRCGVQCGIPGGGPKSYAQALASPDLVQWETAIATELGSMQKQGVFRVKRDARGNVQRYRARLVAQGQTQIPGVDYTDSFAPVVRFETIGTNLAQAVLRRQVVHQSYVETAFMLADMEEECYLELPLGFDFDLKSMVQSGTILAEQVDKIKALCEQFGSFLSDGVYLATAELAKVLGPRLLKCIYGLHQSNRAWNKKLHKALISIKLS